MNILWFTWKDKKNPEAGGAEFLNEELASRLVRDGHNVTFLVAGFKGCRREEAVNGYKIIRLGNKYTVYLSSKIYYLLSLRSWSNLIIEEINTVPFFTQFYAPHISRVLLIYQLCREIWFHQIFFPLNLIGYILEPLYLRLLNNNKVLTESKSTLQDLLKYGFNKDNISVFPVGIETQPIHDTSLLDEFDQPTVLSIGAIRSMKQTLDQIQAFEIAKISIPKLQLHIAGQTYGNYGRKVLDYVKKSPYRKDIVFYGRVTFHKKIDLLGKSHLLLATSVKEGWGLVVTEANTQGTPAIVYNTDGLRDSVIHNKTGIICDNNTPEDMATCIVNLFRNKKKYKALQQNALRNSRLFTITNCFRQFKKALLKEK